MTDLLPFVPALENAQGNMLNMLSTAVNNRKMRKWNEKMYGIQRQDALADWNMQNVYNSPEQQMQRLKAAGLNPNLIYGNGTEASGSSGTVRSSSVESWNPQPPLVRPGNAIGDMYDLKVKQATVDNLEAQNKVIVQDAEFRKAQIIAALVGAFKTQSEIPKIGIDTEIAGINLRRDKELYETSVEAGKEMLRKLMVENQYTVDKNAREAATTNVSIIKAAEEILLLKRQQAKTSAERMEIDARIHLIKTDTRIRQLDEQLYKGGARAADPLIQRKINELVEGAVEGLNRLGRKIDSWIKPKKR